jgi:2-C-methyl-D-erythritol 4-phosphate cytidylyltransferase
MSVDLFTKLPEIKSIWVAVNPSSNNPITFQASKVNLVLTGGDTRSQTVLNTLNLMIERGISITDWILVHDATRPGLSASDIIRLISSVQDKTDCIGGILALPISDTVKKTLPSTDSIDLTISRENLWAAQTPQMFRLGDLKAP